MQKHDIKIGTQVRILDADSILSTLDQQGRLDGLPFMPQMASFCGRTYSVVRWVNNVCYPDSEKVNFANLKNCVVLDLPRCDGKAYGGCQMGCTILWKLNWLSAAPDPVATASPTEANERLHNLTIQNALDAATSYAACQATQLKLATTPRKRLAAEQYVDELTMNRVSATAIATSFCGGLLARLKKQTAVVGQLQRTPVDNLGLQVGDRVQVKPRIEIVQTLDTAGKNRGLWFDPMMLRYCGQELTVTKRIDTLVDEISGKIRQLKTPAIVLEQLHCDPAERRFCSRLLHLFWREIWLQRV